MADRDWDRNDWRRDDRRNQDYQNREFQNQGYQNRDYQNRSWRDERSRDWERNRYNEPGEQPFNRENRDWHNDRDWRSRSYEGNRDWDQNRREGERNWDTRQYSNRDYIGRDYNREDRYRDDQNRDWEHHRWESSRERERHGGDQGFEQPMDRGYNHSGNRYVSHDRSDYTDRRWDRDRGRTATDIDYNRNDAQRNDYTRNWGAQAFGNVGTGFGGGLSESGRHTGRGPKNWQRSDDRIREDVNEELTRNPEVDATEIDVQVSGGEVTLSGSVDDRHEKREAEECAWRVSGVKDVHNQIKVKQGIGSMIANAFKGDSDKK